MNGTPVPARGSWKVWRGICAALFAVTVAASTGRAQAPPLPPPSYSSATAAAAAPPPSAAIIDPNLVQAGCSSCGGGFGHGGDSNPLGCYGCMGEGCDGPRCVPGRMECCEPCEAHSMFGRFWCGLKAACCCPDPCYEPCYIPAANAALFVPSAKPVSQTRIRWDCGLNGGTPDRAEYFFAKFGGKGPGLVNGAPSTVLNKINWDELYFDTEVGTDRFSILVTTPYRFVQNLHAGFGDMSIATKSLLCDSEILMASFQFTTFIPIANFHVGLGNGHVTLEPALLFTLKVMAGTYIQGELAEWIPIAGDPNHAGAALKYQFSVNHVLLKPSNDLQFVGTVEFGGISFQDGLYTAPDGTLVKASSDSYFSVGPGFRLFYCLKSDIGFGMQFGVTQHNIANQLYRLELRHRF